MKKGFSLVELSIVLVILGLLVGGILAGQSLIRASELRALQTEYARFITASNAFRDKYFGLPGDIRNATSFWGAADGTTGLTADCATTASTTMLTCNGNGDGLLSGVTPSNERFRFWQQLANAGLIEGQYDGVTGAGGGGVGTSTNMPKSRLSLAYWFTTKFADSNDAGAAPNRLAAVYGNALYVGGLTATGWPYTPIMTPAEVWNLDVKVDDGKPYTGRLLSFYFTDCTTGTTVYEPNAEYDLVETGTLCVPVWPRAFGP